MGKARGGRDVMTGSPASSAQLRGLGREDSHFVIPDHAFVRNLVYTWNHVSSARASLV